MSKWIEFIEVPKPEGRKTRIYNVVTKDRSSHLGTVSWYAPWRCYAFYPNNSTLFEKQCLQDITDFLKKLMEERKK